MQSRRAILSWEDLKAYPNNYCRIGVVDVVLVDVDVCPTFMETLRLCNFCNFGATLLGFGTVFTNIIVHGIRNFGKNRITLTP